jgi:serine/threonine protein kinase
MKEKARKLQEEQRSRMQTYLIRERDLLQKLDHPNIVSYLGYEEDPDADTYTLYLEFCNSMDLRVYVHDEGSAADDNAALEESEVWELIFYLAAALAYCHHGLSLRNNYQFGFETDWLYVLHRDIKPQNGTFLPKLSCSY